MTFSSVPNVYVRPTANADTNNEGVKCVTSISKTGFNIIYIIGSGGVYNPNIYWVAYI